MRPGTCNKEVMKLKEYLKPELYITALKNASVLNNSNDIDISTKNDGDDGTLF